MMFRSARSTLKLPVKSAVLWLLLALCQGAGAQEDWFRFNWLTVEDGLSHDNVTCIYQDRFGWLWFGTIDGLNRYDGYGFRIYRRSHSAPGSLSDNHITSLAEDLDGALWVATTDGLNRFDYGAETFTQYRHDPQDPSSISANRIQQVFVDDQGVVWAGCDRGGLNRYIPETGGFKRYLNNSEDANSLGFNEVYTIAQDGSGDLWIGTLMTLERYDRQADVFVKYERDGKAGSINDTWVYELLVDREGVLWVGTQWGGLNRYDRETDSFSSYKPARGFLDKEGHIWIKALYEDTEGYIWVGVHGGGLHRFDKETGRFSYFPQKEGDNSHADHEVINALFQDRSGMMWVGSDGGGVRSFNPKKPAFLHFKKRLNHPSSLSHNQVTSIYEDGDCNVWIGTADGLNRFRRETGDFDHWLHNPSNPMSLQRGMVTAIHQDHAGKLWVGTHRGGVSRFYPDQGLFDRFDHDPEDDATISHGSVRVVLEDRERRLWVGTAYGLNFFNPERTGITRVRHDPENPASLSNENITALFEDRSGRLWVGTSGGGLNLHLGMDKGFKHFTKGMGAGEGLSDNRINCIVEDANGLLWLGTYGGGISCFDPQTSRFVHYDKDDGLANDVVYGLLFDKRGHLWASTHEGLSDFDPQGRSFKNYDYHDGLQGSQFNEGAWAYCKDGQLLFGGNNGFNVFRPSDIEENPITPDVVISDVHLASPAGSQQGGDPGLPLVQGIVTRDSLRFSHRDRFFSLEFAGLHYESPERNRYAYKMVGFHEQWVHTHSGNRIATFTNLDPGQYTFRVKASNKDGIWNEEGARIDVVILPPFWMTWWFKLIVVLAVLAFLRWLHHVRVAKLLEVERLRTQIASDLHDDIGGLLTHISMDSEWILLGSSLPDKIQKRADRIGKTSREAIGAFSDIIWSIDVRNDNAEQLLRRIQDTAHKFLATRDIAYTFNASGLKEGKLVAPEFRQNIYLICKEALNNIVKHAYATRVSISLDNTAERFLLVIRDNGRGLSGESGCGHGLRNMKMRARKIGGKLEVSSKDGVEIRLELKRI